MHTRMGRRGTIVVPQALRERLGLRDGSLVIIEERGGAVVITPAVAVPVDEYSRERRAEFLLNNAVDMKDYDRVLQLVREMGIDPGTIPHQTPDTTR